MNQTLCWGEMMSTSVELRSSSMICQLSTQGGTLTGLWWGRSAENGIPLMRNVPAGAHEPVDTAAFPLVPLGNRVSKNSFVFEDKRHLLKPNSKYDPLYIHGDGWLVGWTLLEQKPDSAVLEYRHHKDNTPFRYFARQHFSLNDNALVLHMSVTNEGKTPMPFGLGWHPYFLLDHDTTLQFSAETVRSEEDGSLPGPAQSLSGDFDFSKQRRFPGRRLNNGYSSWNGKTEIRWPQRHAAMTIEADEIFSHAFVYAPFEEDSDYFCFEPMSHMADDHNRDGFGGLQILAPGETLAGSIRLSPQIDPQ